MENLLVLPEKITIYDNNYAVVKRCFDFVAALFCIVLFSPLFLIICIVVKLADGAPVLFSQERVGLHGETFRIYKFRTMTPNAEAEQPLLCDVNDPRLTKVGQWLRSHHLDEIPQLWNVLKGDMSFIGYRPERPYFVEQIMEKNPDYARLYAIRPGITSKATLYNGYTGTMEKMLRRLDMDLEYLDNQSLMLDIKILLKTFISIVSGKLF
ncbi:MAG: sugar transferase [Bacteroidaceae bacterium]|nr:sugar transferase [Bacteroidaceae bacterium]